MHAIVLHRPNNSNHQSNNDQDSNGTTNYARNDDTNSRENNPSNQQHNESRDDSNTFNSDNNHRNKDRDDHQDTSEKTPFDYMPNPHKLKPLELLLQAREKATECMLMADMYASLDHIPYEFCLGYEGASFQEAQDVPFSYRTQWAETISDIMEDFSSVFKETPIDQYYVDPTFSIRLERRIKMFFLFPFLFLCKPPINSNELSLNQIIKLQLSLWK